MSDCCRECKYVRVLTNEEGTCKCPSSDYYNCEVVLDEDVCIDFEEVEEQKMEAFIKPRGTQVANSPKIEPVKKPVVERKTKTGEIIKYLESNGSITSLDAIKLFGATRLAAIIFCLRRKGYIIDSEDRVGIDKYGNSMRYVEYVFHGIEGQTTEEM